MVSHNNIPTMQAFSSCVLFLFAWLLMSYLSIVADGIRTNSTIRCIDEEREALLRFKLGIEVDNCELLSSWGDHNQPDCCTWNGVYCNSHSGHVTKLQFSKNPYDVEEDPNSPFGRCLKGKLGPSLLELKHLNYLDLSSNNLQWIIPAKRRAATAGLCRLKTLDLGDSNLTQDISSIIQPLSNCAYPKLEYLNLNGNRLRGPVPESLNRFTSLTYLDLSHNMLQDTVSERHFSNLSRLKILRLDYNPALVVNVNVSWIPPFQLGKIFLSSCKLGPSFPMWLLTQTNYSFLYLDNTGISDSIPASFWHSLPSHLRGLDMSQNKLYGTLPNFSTDFYDTPSIDLSSNCLEGAIPSFPRTVITLSLANNKFSNPIPLLCSRAKMMLRNLDLSNNSLSGKLPDCWMNLDQLAYLDLGNNNFTGVLPTSIGSLKNLFMLRLRNNSFHGELPTSLQNLTSLYVLDISHNSMTGHITPMIGNFLKHFVVLNLRNNNFWGKLPSSICQLSQLHILDFSANNFSGTIPECIYSLQAMTHANNFGNSAAGEDGVIMWKKKEQGFLAGRLGFVISIAISDNELEGQIPSGISSLKGLGSLDLARNKLTGIIPSNIGQLEALQYLDLSSNHLSGGIPTSLAKVASLEMLDLSNNNLSGRIPQGTQLQTFDPANYSGNPLLCGPPLPKCPGDPAPINRPREDSIPQQEENKSDDIFPGLYISIVLGLITGFWGVFGSLVLKRSWRHACFRFLDAMKDRIYVMFAVKTPKPCRKLRR